MPLPVLRNVIQPFPTFSETYVAALKALNSQIAAARAIPATDACDVPTRWSCRAGVCHTCVTSLLSGNITYAPDPLELPPNGQVLICCARSATDVVLDL